MILNRAAASAGAFGGALLLFLTVAPAARAEPVPRFTQPDVPTLDPVIRPAPSWANRESRPATVEDEHVRAQRIINRVCVGCR